MALNFPNSPSNGQLYTANNVNYYYNSSAGAWFTDLFTRIDSLDYGLVDGALTANNDYGSIA